MASPSDTLGAGGHGAVDATLLARLRVLAEAVQAEARLLAATHARLFTEPMTTARAASLRADDLLAERVDAFVARFGRLQDTLSDKLLPALLQALAETTGAAIDNLSRAERLGWLASVDDWLDVRRLRNRMVHGYVRDPAALAQALDTGTRAVPLLLDTAQRMAGQVQQRWGGVGPG